MTQQPAPAQTITGRPIGTSPNARMVIRRTVTFEYELTSDHYADDSNAVAAELERKMSIYQWFRQNDFDSADEISFEIVWQDPDWTEVPGLAEHTEAACDTITRAANVG